MEFKIKVFENRTELTFSSDVELNTLQKLVKKALIKAEISQMLTGRYLLPIKLDNDRKAKLVKLIRKEYNIPAPVKKPFVKQVKKVTDTICGYVGDPISGEGFEFIYC